MLTSPLMIPTFSSTSFRQKAAAQAGNAPVRKALRWLQPLAQYRRRPFCLHGITEQNMQLSASS
jgi:hypothetical protein